MRHPLRYSLAPITVLALAAPLALTSCGTSGNGINATASYNPGYGPFDRHGNYVEAWADRPAKKHRWAQDPATKPADPSPVIRPSRTEPSVLVSTKPKPARPEPRVLFPSRSSEPAVTPPPVVSRPAPRPTLQASVPTSRPAPKPAPRPKPSTSHRVAKGDTLYSLSRRYGTSVSAIQKANGIKGTTIRLGQVLKIPK